MDTDKCDHCANGGVVSDAVSAACPIKDHGEHGVVAFGCDVELLCEDCYHAAVSRGSHEPAEYPHA